MELQLLLLALLASSAAAYHECGQPGGDCARDPQILPVPTTITEDFQFELRNLYTDRQRGARLNVFTKYRYYTKVEAPYYTTETGTFDYRDIAEVIRGYIPAGGANISRDTYWEVVNRQLAIAVWQAFPIRGLSIRMEVQGMSSGGIAGHRASTVTLGDMEPFVSMFNNFSGCDGMDTDRKNEACTIIPTWGQDANPSAKTQQLSKSKAGKHDKPAKCDFCG